MNLYADKMTARIRLLKQSLRNARHLAEALEDSEIQEEIDRLSSQVDTLPCHCELRAYAAVVLLTNTLQNRLDVDHHGKYP